MTVETRRSLALRVLSGPLAPFGLQVDVVRLCHVLARLEHGAGPDRELDADIHEALGWEVARTPLARRRMAWRCRSPLALRWEEMPSPTGEIWASALLVPWRWSWSAGIVDGQARAWCREDRARPGAPGPRYAECNRLTVPRALSSAALHGHRQIVGETTAAFLPADQIAEGVRHA